MFSTQYANTQRTVIGGTTTPVYDDDSVLLCNTSIGAITINLGSIPSGYWNTTWKLYVDDSGNNAATNNITINAGAGQTINGMSTLVLSTNGACALIRINSNTTFLANLSSPSASGYQYIQNQAAPNLTQRSTIRFIGAGVVAADDSVDSVTTVTINGGVGQAYQYVRNQTDGLPLTQQTTLHFTGAGVVATNNSGTNETDITIAGGIQQAYITVQEEGTDKPQESKLNFTGNAVAVTDTAGVSTDVAINAYHTITDEGGSPLPQQGILNFLGDIVDAVDASTKTNVIIEVYETLTRTTLQGYISASSLKKGKFYNISDGDYHGLNCQGVIVQATSINTISLQGSGIYLNADYQAVGDYSGVVGYTGTNHGIWTTTAPGTFLAGDIVIYNNQNYVKDSAIHTWSPAPGVSTNWTLLTPSVTNGYIQEVDFVKYDIAGNNVIYRADRRCNEIELNPAALYTRQPLYTFQWGNNRSTHNKIIGASIWKCTNSNNATYSNVLNYGSISDQSETYSGTITNNQLSGSSEIDFVTNYFNNQGDVSFNCLSSGSSIKTAISPTVATSYYGFIVGNVLTNYSTITVDGLSGSKINYNTLSQYGSLSAGVLTNTDIQKNTISASSFTIQEALDCTYQKNQLITASLINLTGTVGSKQHSFQIEECTLSNGAGIYGTALTGYYIKNCTFDSKVASVDFSGVVPYDTHFYNYRITQGLSNFPATLDMSDPLVYDAPSKTITMPYSWAGRYYIANAIAQQVQNIVTLSPNFATTIFAENSAGEVLFYSVDATAPAINKIIIDTTVWQTNASNYTVTLALSGNVPMDINLETRKSGSTGVNAIVSWNKWQAAT